MIQWRQIGRRQSRQLFAGMSWPRISRLRDEFDRDVRRTPGKQFVSPQAGCRNFMTNANPVLELREKKDEYNWLLKFPYRQWMIRD